MSPTAVFPPFTAWVDAEIALHDAYAWVEEYANELDGIEPGISSSLLDALRKAQAAVEEGEGLSNRVEDARQGVQRLFNPL